MDGKFQRTPAFNITKLPGSLPVAQVAEDVDLEAVAVPFIQQLSSIGTEAFTADALWRDSFALTGTLRTFFSADTIANAWKETTRHRSPSNFALIPHSGHIVRLGPETSWVDVGFTFETAAPPATLCSGFISLVPDNKGGWNIWLLRTILEQLKGQANVDTLEAQSDIANGIPNGIKGNPEPRHFDCVIVGAGQAGLAIAGRLKALGLSYLILDRNERVGDSWMLRYDSVKLHTLREYAHLPFGRTFSPDEPEFLPKQNLAAGHQRYADKFGINLWLSTSVESSSWSEEKKTWTIKIRRQGKEETITALHLVFAVGTGGQIPIIPEFPNRESFKGTVIHSAYYKSSVPWKGKTGVVIGSANTGHDVALDMVEAGLSSVTMVQRGRTHVLPIPHYLKFSTPIYNDKIPTELADRIMMSSPTSVTRLMTMKSFHALAREDDEYYDALERAGFKVERYGDLFQCLYERFGGHYMDVGASAKIAQGLIKMKSDATPTAYTPSGLLFSDGTELLADVIVFTTGFQKGLRESIAPIVGSEIADNLEDFWCVDAEGELLGAFKHTGHPRLWYCGGTIGHARYYSRFVALQIKAELMGTPLEIYTGLRRTG